MHCDCGHTQSDHKLKVRYKGGKVISSTPMECDWVDCPCKKFNFHHSEKPKGRSSAWSKWD